MDNLDVRKAITLAIDRKQLVEQVTKSEEVPASGFIAPHEASVEKAQKYLAKAGYENGEGFPKND